MTCFVDRKSIGFILHHRQQQQQQYTRRDESKLIYFNVLLLFPPLFFLFPVRTFYTCTTKKFIIRQEKVFLTSFFLFNFWPAVMYNGERGVGGAGREYESHCSAQVVIFHVI
jgi:hypothetical protein